MSRRVSDAQPRLLTAPDKFKGTVTAHDAGAAMARAAVRAGWHARVQPMADGGEGTLDMFPGRRITAEVAGPLGAPTTAEFTMTEDRIAVVEMARASGLAVVGGADGNDPVAADTRGTGELIVAAARAGAEHIVVGVGGSATTDGGLGCIAAMQDGSRHLRGITLTVLADVDTGFVDAARTFAPQKGATPLQVELLERRLRALVLRYDREFGVDVSGLVGGGAAGGLAGGLAAWGAVITGGSRYLAELVDLDEQVGGVDVVVTGEGSFDEQSMAGKATSEVISAARRAGKAVLVVAGRTSISVPGVETLSLVDLFGSERALNEPLECIEQALYEKLSGTS